jgi:Complex 1 protein (LYR family)
MAASKEFALLYMNLRRCASSFKDPNFKAYFSRIVKDDFKTAATTEDFLQAQRKNLEILERPEHVLL